MAATIYRPGGRGSAAAVPGRHVGFVSAVGPGTPRLAPGGQPDRGVPREVRHHRSGAGPRGRAGELGPAPGVARSQGRGRTPPGARADAGARSCLGTYPRADETLAATIQAGHDGPTGSVNRRGLWAQTTCRFSPSRMTTALR